MIAITNFFKELLILLLFFLIAWALGEDGNINTPLFIGLCMGHIFAEIGDIKDKMERGR